MLGWCTQRRGEREKHGKTMDRRRLVRRKGGKKEEYAVVDAVVLVR